MKRLVVFYSLEGNTREAAQMIADKLGADLLEIKTKKSIPADSSKKFMIGGMQAVFGVCPKLEPVQIAVNDYDQILLGTPVWASKCAPAIKSFLKSSQADPKVEAVFTFSGGGDNDKCLKRLKKKLPNLKWSVALADRANPIASENAGKIEHFVEEIRDGK